MAPGRSFRTLGPIAGCGGIIGWGYFDAYIDISEEELDLLFNDDNIKGGGAASIAYSRLQFCEMSNIERTEIINALLKYCELDTLAMVMIVEAWKNMLQL